MGAPKDLKKRKIWKERLRKKALEQHKDPKYGIEQSKKMKGMTAWNKDLKTGPLSEEHKKLLSIVHTGYKQTSEHIEKNRIRQIGKKKGPRSEEVKKQISEKMKIIQVGKNNSNWKGGIACEPYCDAWLDKEYKESIKKRDGYKCLNPYCNKKSRVLVLHHINYIKKDCRPTNLITVCISCNGRANTDRSWHEKWYSSIIHRRYNYGEKSRKVR